MRMLAVERLVTEMGPDSFGPNRFTAFMTQPPAQDWVRLKYEFSYIRQFYRTETIGADQTSTASP